MEPVHAPDTDGIRTRALNIGAHTVKEVGNVNYVAVSYTHLDVYKRQVRMPYI